MDDKKKTENHLILVDKISKKIQEPRSQEVFPLTPTHRKELRTLRDRNVGSLRTQLAFIKSEKKKEYFEKYKSEIQKELKKEEKVIGEVNESWKRDLESIYVILNRRRELESQELFNNINLDTGYSSFSPSQTNDKAQFMDKNRRQYNLNLGQMSETIAYREFKEKFNEPFEKAGEEIDKLNTLYEEGINFGDLEIVKQLYYRFKDADLFLKQVQLMKI